MKLTSFLLLLYHLLSLTPVFGRESLRVGLTGKYPPFNYYNSQSELVGFDVDVAREVCQRINRQCEFVTLQWDGILASLLSNKIDVIIGSMAITEERQKQVQFSVPYYESGAQVFVKNSTIDLTQVQTKFGVTLGTTYEANIRQTFPAAEVKTYKGDTEILQDLEQGRIDAMVTDKLVGAYMINELKANVSMHGPSLFIEKMGIPVNPRNKALFSQINQAVIDLRDSPAYQGLLDKYFALDKVSSKPEEINWLFSLNLLFKGALSTLKLSFFGLVSGFSIAIFLAYFSTIQLTYIRKAIKVVTDFIRATPFIIQLFGIYFGFPSLGIELSAFNSAILAMAIHSSAYLTEIFITGYLSVPKGQKQAAQIMGMTRLQSLKFVIVPQMVPIITTPTLNTIIAMIKDSAIVSVISVYELTMQAQQLISTTFRPFEFYAITAILYALLTYPLIILCSKQEAKMKQKGLIHV